MEGDNNAPAPGEEALETELASLIRVRNRLAHSPDASLPKILTGLLPKLLMRLERSYTYQQPECTLRQEIRQHVVGILMHALERIRGNTYMEISWLPAILSSLESNNHMVRMMTLSFVREAMPRCTPTSANAPLQVLIKLLDRLHVQVINEEMTESTRNEWCTTSWLILDAIAMLSGLEPMIDWDLDCYNQEGRLGVYEPPKDAFTTTPVIESSVIQTISENGMGLWHLVLDVLLYWPETFQRPGRAAPSPLEGISQKGLTRMKFRLKEQSWNEMTQGYFRHLKRACFQFAVSREYPCAFEGERGLVLAILMSGTTTSMRQAASSLVNIHLVERQEAACPLYLACSLLVLVLGDETSTPILDKYSEQANVSTILGPRPTQQGMRHLPLSTGMSTSVIDFIGSHLHLTNSAADGHETLELFVDLAVSVQENIDSVQAIQLIHVVYKQVNSIDSSEWMDDFNEKCLSCAKDTLSRLPDAAVLRRDPIEQVADGEDEGAEAMARFRRRRRAADDLFTRHRHALRKKRLEDEDAVKARESAYEIICKLGGKSVISVDLAVLLFKCAVLEDIRTVPRAVEALEKLLMAFKSILAAETSLIDSLQHEAARLLPTLVEAACCEAECVRLVAAQWTVELLVLCDPPAAYCLSCFLAGDATPRVAATVKSVAKNSKLQQSCQTSGSNHVMYEFLDLSTDRDSETITMELNLRISTIARTLGIPTSAASILLNCFEGSPRKALDACAKDKDGVLKDCGVQARCAYGDHPSSSADEMKQDFVCGICYDDEVAAHELHALPCGHCFCKACWKSYLENKLEEGPTHILNATCPRYDCPERVTGVEVNEIVPQFTQKWKDYYLRQFVVSRESNHRFCPGVDCNVVVVGLGDSGPVCCSSCNTSFCFGCGSAPHVPANCGDFDSWKTIFGSSQFWIATHSKPCPGCGVHIVKDQGCNHMTCSRCHYDFCWVCLARLDRHLMDHTCNQYNPVEHAETDDERMRLFYTARFQAHEEAQFFAADRFKGVDDKVLYLLDKYWLLNEEDAQELVAANETLVECRHFLKNSYVAAFGMKDDQTRRKIFEYHQGALELLTEKLSALTEVNLEQFYVERGENAMHLHFRAVSFYTSIVKKYMDRIIALDDK